MPHRQSPARIQKLQRGGVVAQLLKKAHALNVCHRVFGNDGALAVDRLQNSVIFKHLHGLTQNVSADVQHFCKTQLVHQTLADREASAFDFLNEVVDKTVAEVDFLMGEKSQSLVAIMIVSFGMYCVKTRGVGQFYRPGNPLYRMQDANSKNIFAKM